MKFTPLVLYHQQKNPVRELRWFSNGI